MFLLKRNINDDPNNIDSGYNINLLIRMQEKRRQNS